MASGATRRSSARTVCDLLRLLATADPSVALVSAMHPAVLAFWLLNPDPSQPKWEQQRQAVFASAESGEQWGTITSEPGSGGDIGRTRATATPTDDAPFISGARVRDHRRQALREWLGHRRPDDHDGDP